MNNDNLYYLLILAEEGHFSRAAKKLGISQPALSAYLAKQEQALGAILFDRSATPLKPTAAGEAVLAYVRQVRREERQLEKQIADLRLLRCGSLTVAGSAADGRPLPPALPGDPAAAGQRRRAGFRPPDAERRNRFFPHAASGGRRARRPAI